VDGQGPDPQRPLTPGEALAKFFLDNADRGWNAANDELCQRQPKTDQLTASEN
jgi:hypothetical protein